MRLITHDILDSTNAEGLRYLKESGTAALPVWIMCHEQTRGRGRRGRDWISQKGNLFCSGIYPLSSQPAIDAQKSFVASLAVYDVISAYVDEKLVSIKWPNDVLIKGAKVSGLLLERHQNGLVIGIGINLIHAPKIQDYLTGSVLEHIRPSNLDDCLLYTSPSPRDQRGSRMPSSA